jgi:hypothetical protein
VTLEDAGEMVVLSVIAWFVYKRSESLYPNLNSLEQQEKTFEGHNIGNLIPQDVHY